MMTRELEISILAAPLASIDRRALSQAWYSALRLAAPSPGAGSQYCAGGAPPIAPGPAAAVRCPHSKTVAVAIAGPRAAGASQHTMPGVAAETLASSGSIVRTPLAQRIERAFSVPALRPRRATFSLGRGSARVHIILQTNGASQTLLALCRPELRGIVGSALAYARIALAARGIGLQLRLVGGRKCSSTQA